LRLCRPNPDPAPPRYELEEDAEVCAAMERMAQLFLQDGFRDGAEAESPTSPAPPVPATAG